jgi:pimeloyl-ACP methyl ester carboxylesterase
MNGALDRAKSTPHCASLKVPGADLYYKVRGRGPVLLMIQGGGGNADASDGVAAQLEADFTIVSYDRRGLLRSPRENPGEALTIATHATDVVALLDHLGVERVLVFASSLGALIGLDLMARCPERVDLLVAHEPTATGLLSPEGQALAAERRKAGLEVALSDGPRAALRHMLAGMGVNRDDREEDCEPPASSRQQSKDTGFLLLQEVRAVDRWSIDLPAILPHAQRVVPAFGVGSREFYPAQCALALAEKLARVAVALPGAHNGYVLRPREFAGALRHVLLDTDERMCG